ncbi:MAG TPA: hypothetical protein VMT03_10805 [Polyangia bacterium]|nr:hypothetical protein [Polyangia bacterium]
MAAGSAVAPAAAGSVAAGSAAAGSAAALVVGWPALSLSLSLQPAV